MNMRGLCINRLWKAVFISLTFSLTGKINLGILYIICVVMFNKFTPSDRPYVQSVLVMEWDGFPGISPDIWRRIFGCVYGYIGVASFVAYAGNGSSSTDVAVICQVHGSYYSSLHIPSVAVVGRLPLVEWDGFLPTYAT